MYFASTTFEALLTETSMTLLFGTWVAQLERFIDEKATAALHWAKTVG